MRKAYQTGLILVVLVLAFVPCKARAGDGFPSAPEPQYIVAPGLFAVRVVQQNGDRGYVPSQYGIASQFTDAGWYGTIGILAHDYLSGQHFYGLTSGKMVVLFYGDRVEIWRVTDAFYYYPTRELTPEMMFDRVYRNGGLVFQTCKGSGYFFAIAQLERMVER